MEHKNELLNVVYSFVANGRIVFVKLNPSGYCFVYDKIKSEENDEVTWELVCSVETQRQSVTHAKEVLNIHLNNLLKLKKETHGQAL